MSREHQNAIISLCSVDLLTPDILQMSENFNIIQIMMTSCRNGALMREIAFFPFYVKGFLFFLRAQSGGEKLFENFNSRNLLNYANSPDCRSALLRYKFTL